MTKTIQNGGFTNPAGGLLTGNLLLVLSQDAKVAAAPNQVAPIATRIPISAGNIAPTLIYFNDELLPNNTYYTATAYDAAGNKTYGPEIVSLTGAGPLDLGTLVPLLISPDPLFSNPVLQNPASVQTITGQGLTLTSTAPLTVQGTLTASGTLNCKTVEPSIRCVDAANTQAWAGSDFGAWINSAAASAGNYSVIWAFGPATNTTAINLSGNGQVLVLFPGTYTASASWTASGVGSGFTASNACSVRTAGAGLNLPPVLIKQANSVNLSALVTLSGQVSFLECIAMDGNKANNPTGTIGLLVNKAGGVHAHSFTSQNFSSHGIQVLSTAGTRNNESDTFKAWDFQSSTNNGHGISCISTNDMFIHGGFEAIGNSLNGLDLSDCGAARVWDGELSFNVDGVKMYGTLAGNGTANVDLHGIHFAGNSSHDVNLQGWDTVGAGIANQQNTICNNKMIGSANVADNVNPSILIQDSTLNTICNNTIASTPSHRWKSLIQMLAVNQGAGGGTDVIYGVQGYGTAGTGAGVPTGGITALANNSVYGNNIFSTIVASQNLILANGQCVSIYNNAGSSICMVQLDTSNNPFIAGNGNLFIRPNGAASNTGQINLSSTNINPGTGGAVALGANGAPWGSLALGTTSNAFIFTPVNPAATRTVTINDPLGNVTLPFVIASGTATMTTAAIASQACGTVVTVAAANVATTDTIAAEDNAQPAAATNGVLIIKSWPTAGNVNFFYCNPTAGSVTPAAATLNWRVVR